VKLHLIGPTLLFRHGDMYPYQDYLEAMLATLRNLKHPRYEEMLDRFNAINAAPEERCDLEDALFDDLEALMIDITPRGYRWVRGELYDDPEQGWYGWVGVEA
jgi:hypothetical protein